MVNIHKYPAIYRVSYMSGGDRRFFFPSTVCWVYSWLNFDETFGFKFHQLDSGVPDKELFFWRRLVVDELHEDFKVPLMQPDVVVVATNLHSRLERSQITTIFYSIFHKFVYLTWSHWISIFHRFYLVTDVPRPQWFNIQRKTFCLPVCSLLPHLAYWCLAGRQAACVAWVYIMTPNICRKVHKASFPTHLDQPDHGLMGCYYVFA